MPVMEARRRAGFTLIELSIVLVVIGLLVGGILVGRELIKSAQIRAQITQIEKYDAAVNTFRVKYGYRPGDLPSYLAARFGFFAIPAPLGGSEGHQDGNGRVEADGDGTESFIFWRHLSEAGLIEGSYGTDQSGTPLDAATGDVPGPGAINTPELIGRILPKARIGDGNYLTVGVVDWERRNVWRLAGVWSINPDGWGGVMPLAALRPLDAYRLDAKLDNGRPDSGRVQEDAAGYLCVVAAVYNIDGDSEARCALVIGFQ